MKGVSFDINAGDFVMITGPSGCGKSTLMNIINGWEPPTSGTVEVNGQDLFLLKEKEKAMALRHSIGMMSQSAFWVKSLSVVDNVGIPYLMAGKSKGETISRATALLEMLNLERFAAYKPVDLSGGQQQRVSFLRSLVNNPIILMADEPTGNLDTKSSDFMINLFSTLNSSLGKTIVMVTHNMELLQYASKVVHMKDGLVEKIVLQAKKGQKLTGLDLDVLELANKHLITVPEESELEEVVG